MRKQEQLASTIVDGLIVTVLSGFNRPDHLEITVEVPSSQYDQYDKAPFTYDKRYVGDGWLYFAHDLPTGLVRFYSYSRPGAGFGGSVFTLSMRDGTTDELIGPWSSRCSVMNHFGFEPSAEITLINRYRFASAMSIARLTELVAPMNFVFREKRTGSVDLGYWLE